MLPFLEGQYHKINLTFEVDINLKPSLTQSSYIDPAIKSLPKTLTDKMDSKIPVIGFFDNSSIISFWNEKEKCYKFSEKWNGLYGEDLYISFDKKKPKFRNEAYKVLKEKPTFVVFDLIKILKSKTDYVSPLWQFSITKDEENPIYIEFDNFDGSRKHAPPELLMALLIKDHLKIIKEEIGEKPVEIGFIFF
uniref:Uncharacterized protein n=1 Tax=Panagrolaimus sp. PS1159 TaxID=55785 RepID=A0AC35FJ10_9BILA